MTIGQSVQLNAEEEHKPEPGLVQTQLQLMEVQIVLGRRQKFKNATRTFVPQVSSTSLTTVRFSMRVIVMCVNRITRNQVHWSILIAQLSWPPKNLSGWAKVCFCPPPKNF